MPIQEVQEMGGTDCYRVKIGQKIIIGDEKF